MAKKKNGYRSHFTKSLDDLILEETRGCRPPTPADKRAAKARLRMYANLFNRDMRKLMLSDDSVCCVCLSKTGLQIDHIIPVSLGGKNEQCNTQILCSKCNRSKSNYKDI